MQATFHLQKMVDGVSTEIDSVEVGKEQSWIYTWTDLPVYENGKKITYSVKEVLTKANGYKSDTTKWKVVANGGKITITNTLRDETPGTGDNTKTLLWGSLRQHEDPAVGQPDADLGRWLRWRAVARRQTEKEGRTIRTERRMRR